MKTNPLCATCGCELLDTELSGGQCAECKAKDFDALVEALEESARLLGPKGDAMTFQEWCLWRPRQIAQSKTSYALLSRIRGGGEHD